MTSATTDALLFLAENSDWLMHRPEAEEAFSELLAATGLIRQTIDTSGPRVYAGPCDVCGKDMYGRPEAREVECRPCALIYPMRERRDWLLSRVEDQLERAADIARALTSMGYEVTRFRIGTWADRGRIVARGQDRLGRPLYRVGDVIDLLHSERTKRPDRRTA